MIYCFDKSAPFIYINDEITLAKLKNDCIFFDANNNIFYDSNNNEISIRNKIIFPRTGYLQLRNMNNVISELGGIPIISNEELNMIESWPNYYKTLRKMEIMKGQNLIDSKNIEYIERIYGSEIFIKTKEKNFSSPIPISLLKDPECAFYKTLKHHRDDDFIISEKVNIVNDRYGKKEYRCIIINNEIYNISRFTVNLLHSIDKNILDKLNQIITKINRKLPACYVVDLFEYYDMHGNIQVDVNEFNPINTSGIYLYNSIIEKSDDLLHSDILNVSTEFKKEPRNYSLNGSIINDRNNFYDIPKSFSANLKNMCVSGNFDTCFCSFRITEKDFANHDSIIDYSLLSSITSDKDLSSHSNPFDGIEGLQKILKL